MHDEPGNRRSSHALRPLTVDDVEACLTLWRDTPGMGLSSADEPDELARFVDRNAGLCWCADGPDGLVATVLCGSDGRRGYLYHVAVTTPLRRTGLGSAIVRTALESLAASGVRKCHAMVFADNESGRSFWEHVGWVPRSDLVVFSRDLDS